VIHIEQKADFEKPRIIRERAVCDEQLLFERDLDGVRFRGMTEMKPDFRSTGGRRRSRQSSRAENLVSWRCCRRKLVSF
jgi:hypothetical protein